MTGMRIFNDFHTVTSHKQKVIYRLKQIAGGSLVFTDTPLYQKFCYKMSLSIFIDFVVIARITTNLVFPALISKVYY